MLEKANIDGKSKNGRDGAPLTDPTLWGLGNTDPLATRGPTLGLARPSVAPSASEQEQAYPGKEGPLGAAVRMLRLERGPDLDYGASGARLRIVEAKSAPKPATRQPAGQVVLFQKIMHDWGFGDQDASTLLGFESVSDLREIYLGAKPVGHRDANDRLRDTLRIATDLYGLFRSEAAIRDWLSEPQRDLDGTTPRSLLTEGSMENLLRVKYYVAYLSGR